MFSALVVYCTLVLCTNFVKSLFEFTSAVIIHDAVLNFILLAQFPSHLSPINASQRVMDIISAISHVIATPQFCLNGLMRRPLL